MEELMVIRDNQISDLILNNVTVLIFSLVFYISLWFFIGVFLPLIKGLIFGFDENRGSRVPSFIKIIYLILTIIALILASKEYFTSEIVVQGLYFNTNIAREEEIGGKSVEDIDNGEVYKEGLEYSDNLYTKEDFVKVLEERKNTPQAVMKCEVITSYEEDKENTSTRYIYMDEKELIRLEIMDKYFELLEKYDHAISHYKDA